MHQFRYCYKICPCWQAFDFYRGYILGEARLPSLSSEWSWFMFTYEACQLESRCTNKGIVLHWSFGRRETSKHGRSLVSENGSASFCLQRSIAPIKINGLWWLVMINNKGIHRVKYSVRNNLDKRKHFQVHTCSGSRHYFDYLGLNQSAVILFYRDLRIVIGLTKVLFNADTCLIQLPLNLAWYFRSSH